MFPTGYITLHASTGHIFKRFFWVAVPKIVLHLKKRSVGLEPDHNSVTINFEDGSSVTQDLVVVSDGIHLVGFLMT
jgi:2-polyprenyl-6-methoxyphenol hydroxylase-like FAD-dependent oxidoreductase